MFFAYWNESVFRYLILPLFGHLALNFFEFPWLEPFFAYSDDFFSSWSTKQSEINRVNIKKKTKSKWKRVGSRTPSIRSPVFELRSE